MYNPKFWSYQRTRNICSKATYKQQACKISKQYYNTFGNAVVKKQVNMMTSLLTQYLAFLIVCKKRKTFLESETKPGMEDMFLKKIFDLKI